MIRYMFVSRGFAETFQFPVKIDKFVIANISRDNLPNISDLAANHTFVAVTTHSITIFRRASW